MAEEATLGNLSLVVLIALTALSARGSTILQDNPSGVGQVSGILGESFLTPSAGGPWNSISFTLLSTAGISQAAGNLFLLSSLYSGAPNQLSSSTSGFIAESTGITGGFWTFASNVTLQPNSEYYVYMDGSAMTPGAAAYGNTLTGAIGYIAQGDSPSGPYGSAGMPFSFDLTGSVAGAPEPGTAALALVWLVGLVVARGRQTSHV
jgi:hypothetical protein